MSIVSLHFFNFILVLLITYFIIPVKWRWIVITVANVIFYLSFGVQYFLFILLTSTVTYFAARIIQDLSDKSKQELQGMSSDEEKKTRKKEIMRKRKFVCTLTVILIMGIWIVLKYTNFFIDNVNHILSFIVADYSINRFNWILPLGISFYSFCAVGYLVDVYRSKYVAEKNYLKIFTFVSFFPHIIQGPFSRYDQLGAEIFEEHHFSYDRLCQGCARILWGYFKKIVIADQFNISVVAIFENWNTYTGLYMVYAIIAYSIQLYADFSGYMDIMCGISHILGIKLTENFDRPYFSRSIDEFWRRWHITLGTWFRDYVFYPVSMGKFAQKLGKKARKKWNAKMGKLVPGYFALIFVWTATGLWHGANWTYLVWGYMNLAVIVFSMQFQDTYLKIKEKCHITEKNVPWKIVGVLRTFILISFFRFFSAAPDLSAAVNMLKACFGTPHLDCLMSPTKLMVGTEYLQCIFMTVGALILVVVELLGELKVWDTVKSKTPFIVRNIAYTIMILLILMSIGDGKNIVGGFMYASF